MFSQARWVVLGGLGSIGSRHIANLKLLGIEPVIVDPAGGLDDAPQEGDNVIVAAPTAFHADLLSVWGRQANAVLIEKPPTITSAEWRDLSRSLSCKLAVAFNWRFHSIVENARQINFDGLELDSFENVQRFPGRAHLIDPKQGGGIVLTSGVHSIDLACYLMGGPGIFEDGETSASQMFLRMKHVRGFSGIWMIWDWIGKELRRLVAYGDGNQPITMGFLTLPSDMHLKMMRAFVHYAETGEPGNLCTAEQAQWVMDIADQLKS